MVFFICPPHADVRAHSFTPPSPSCAHPTLLEKLYLSNYLCAYRRLHDAAARYGRPDGLLAAFMLVLLMCFLGRPRLCLDHLFIKDLRKVAGVVVAPEHAVGDTHEQDSVRVLA